MLLEDVPVVMSEQGNKLIKHYTFDNERVVMSSFGYCITSALGRIGKTISMSGSRLITFENHLLKMSRALIKFLFDI